jgi:hypothetical protein
MLFTPPITLQTGNNDRSPTILAIFINQHLICTVHVLRTFRLNCDSLPAILMKWNQFRLKGGTLYVKLFGVESSISVFYRSSLAIFAYNFTNYEAMQIKSVDFLCRSLRASQRKVRVIIRQLIKVPSMFCRPSFNAIYVLYHLKVVNVFRLVYNGRLSTIAIV